MLKRFSGSSPKTKTQKKRVSFNEEENDVFQIYKFENKNEIWVTRDEANQFISRDVEMLMLLKEMSPHELEIRTGQSPRGLEGAADEEVRRSFRRRRTSSVIAVIATQKLFQRQEKDGWGSIARAYGLASESAAEHAFKLAKEDHRFVDDHVRNNERLSGARIFEKRSLRPSLIERQNAFRQFKICIPDE